MKSWVRRLFSEPLRRLREAILARRQASRVAFYGRAALLATLRQRLPMGSKLGARTARVLLYSLAFVVVLVLLGLTYCVDPPIRGSHDPEIMCTRAALRRCSEGDSGRLFTCINDHYSECMSVLQPVKRPDPSRCPDVALYECAADRPWNREQCEERKEDECRDRLEGHHPRRSAASLVRILRPAI